MCLSLGRRIGKYSDKPLSRNPNTERPVYETRPERGSWTWVSDMLSRGLASRKGLIS